MEALRTKLLEFGVSEQAIPGETESGDLYLVRPFRSGVLVAVVDGLGHGAEAAEAARIALRTLEANAGETPVALVRRCHEVLPGTRGVVMSLASFNAADDTVTWLGVGNVEGWLAHGVATGAPEAESLVLRGGVVGSQIPELRAAVIPVSPGDILVFATDGITPGFSAGFDLFDGAQAAANRVMARYYKGTDDALVLVARYLGGPS